MADKPTAARARRSIRFTVATHPNEPFPLPPAFRFPTAIAAEKGKTVGECVGRAVARLNGMTFIQAAQQADDSWTIEVWGCCVGLGFTIDVAP